MKRVAAAIGTVLALLALGAPAYADQLRAGLAAFGRHDYVKAGRLLQRPAERGNAQAQTVLCYLYTTGFGVPRSNAAAADWCLRAADQGNVQAQYMLGLLYNKGHGVPENYILAYKWMNLAASRAAGPKKDYSFRIRDAIASKMSPAQVERAQELSAEWRPSPEASFSALDKSR
jgi:TPR repeat protein